jgi:hypothetical protein
MATRSSGVALPAVVGGPLHHGRSRSHRVRKLHQAGVALIVSLSSPATVPRAMARLGFHSGLASALFVSAFQPFIALAVTGAVRPAWTAAMFLFVWTMYLADRLKLHPEDDHEADGNAAAFVRRHQRAVWILFALLVAAQGVLVAVDPALVRPIALATLISLLYLVRLPLVRRRVKEIAYLKCFYLAGTALLLVALFTPGLAGALDGAGGALLAACFSLYFLNFSLFDAKDVEADRRANIRSLAGAVPLGIFLRAQIGASLLTLLAALWLLPPTVGGVLATVCIFHAGASAWLARHPFDGVVCGIVDAGYGAIVGLGTVALMLHG